MFVFNTVKLLIWCSTIIIVVTIKHLDDNQDKMHKSHELNINIEFPFLVGLISDGANKNLTICTGTLLSAVFVMSSVYCTMRLQTDRIKAYRRVSTSLEYRRALNVYRHPSYDSVYRLSDLSLIQLKKPFFNVDRFVKLSSHQFKNDIELECVIVGIGAPYSSGYKVPVHVQYGSSACYIPELNPGLKYLIGYTWKQFLCAKTVGPSPHVLPCDSSDALLCHGNKQYGIVSYGYSTSASSRAAEVTECGDPSVQSRHLSVNEYVDWIADTLSKHGSQANVVGKPRQPANTTTTLREPAVSNSNEMFSPTDPVPGSPIDQDDYPYLVYLEGQPEEPVCGGTLITPLHVLTSAYCTIRMYNVRFTKVNLLSSSGIQTTNASLIYEHPDFDIKTLTADISVVVLNEPFNISRYAKLVDSSIMSDGSETRVIPCAVVAKRLWLPYHYVPVKVKYGPKACRKSIDSDIQMAVNHTWHEFICGIPKNRIPDDTGDPLICHGLQYGIISHSYRMMKATEKGTDQVRFLLVKNYKQWIDDVIAESGSVVLRNYLNSTLAIIVLLLLKALFRT